MNMLNQIIIEGTVDKIQSEPGESTATFKIAVPMSYKNADGESCEEIDFFDVDIFGRLAEVCKPYAKKGITIRVVGRLKQSIWTDKEGNEHSKVSIQAEHIDFMSKNRTFD